MRKVSFQESRSLQYEMLKEIHNFCNDNNICYYIAFGTLLGAVRHKGFIPWDDDLDIIMPYQDFIRFQTEYKSEKYCICSCLNDKDFGFEFGRMYDNRTYGLHGGKKVGGVCIDIYILYGTPEKKMYNFGKYLKRFRENRIKLALFRNFLLKHNLLFGKTNSFAPLNWYCRKYTRYMAKFSNISENIAISGIRYYQSRRPFDERVLLKFEDCEFYAPKGYDDCLSKWYGDYMQLPPEDKRVPYHGFDCYWK